MNVGNAPFAQITGRAHGVMENTAPSRALQLDTALADMPHGANQLNLLDRILLK